LAPRQDPEPARGALLVAELVEVPVDSVDVPRRPARRFLGDIAALAESMHDYGLQQPISVRAQGDRFALTSGLRRLSAARLLRWPTIPAFVRSVDADHAYLLDLIENLQREDLSPEEEADALREVIRTRGWTLQQLADAIKRSVGYVSKRIRVFDDPLVRQAIAERGLAVSTAEELLAVEGAPRAALIERALAERWDQTRARQEVQRLLAPGSAEPVVRGSLVVTDAGGPAQALPSGRPRGLTRAIREFHQLIAILEPPQLTDADRAALRALYRDLALLARAPTTPRAPVFPPLPRVSNAAATASGSRRRAR
jgi:ParB family chromosome partitioning protein